MWRGGGVVRRGTGRVSHCVFTGTSGPTQSSRGGVGAEGWLGNRGDFFFFLITDDDIDCRHACTRNKADILVLITCRFRSVH